MSCPCFSPSHPRGAEPGAKGLLAPLGDLYAGACLADPGDPVAQEDAQLTLCNLGYARGECARVPAGAADAVRFALARDDGQALEVHYVIERGHHPVEHGTFLYRLADQTISNAPLNEPFRAQASAYAASYLRRKAAS